MRRKGYRDLLVWQQSLDLAEKVYLLTREFPKTEEYVLGSQMRRAAVSVPSNIAEGSGRGTNKDQVSFLRIAVGSLRELDTQLELSRRLGFLSVDAHGSVQGRIDSIETLLYRLISALEK